jgi:hypothetical protein
MVNNAYWIAAAARRASKAPTHTVASTVDSEKELKSRLAEFTEKVAGVQDLELKTPTVYENNDSPGYPQISAQHKDYLFTIWYAKKPDGWIWYLNDKASLRKYGDFKEMFEKSRRSTFSEIADLARSVHGELKEMRKKEFDGTFKRQTSKQ